MVFPYILINVVTSGRRVKQKRGLVRRDHIKSLYLSIWKIPKYNKILIPIGLMNNGKINKLVDQITYSEIVSNDVKAID